MEVSENEVALVAAEYVRRLPQVKGSRAHVVALIGDLGSGKTTFVQHVARQLGVTQPVVSPTYVIVSTYPLQHPAFERLVHIDAYRLEGDVRDTIALADYVADPANLVFIEWPVHAPTPLAAGTPTVTFRHVSAHVRDIVEGVYE